MGHMLEEQAADIGGGVIALHIIHQVSILVCTTENINAVVASNASIIFDG